MAAFKQHVTFSSILGVGYAVVLTRGGEDWVVSILAGALCGFAGMLPDLDSPSGKPVREVFGLAAILVPLLLARRLRRLGLDPEQIVLSAAVLYIFIRFGLAWLLARVSVHRGMFHSIPAALIAAEIVFLMDHGSDSSGRWILAGGMLLGYLSHLVLDELSSVDATGLVPRLNQAAGSALKFFSRSIPATALTWLLLGVLTYCAGVEQGYVRPVDLHMLPLSGERQPPDRAYNQR